MRLLDLLRNASRQSKEGEELRELQARLRPYADSAKNSRAELCARVVEQVFSGFPGDTADPVVGAAWRLVMGLLFYEGHFLVPHVDRSRLSTAEMWEFKASARRQLALFENPEMAQAIEEVLTLLLRYTVPERAPSFAEGTASLAVPLHALLPEPERVIEAAIALFLADERGKGLFPRLSARLEQNLLTASGIDPESGSRKPIVPPTKADGDTEQIVSDYLNGTPITDYLHTQFPFSIPLASRFEHMHVLGGSGHGKTQLLQSLMLCDIEQLEHGRGSLVVIDSQGDMIRTILSLASVGEMADRLVLIDPNDIEHPPCLNLFDFGLERLDRYSPVEREKLVNGAIALYEYLFGALLGAELTQRQGVIFRYLARLLMVVPGATIHTLRAFMEQPESVRPHLQSLDPLSRQFFETQFFSKVFDDTRQQILTRLWGVLSNSVLARMFSHAQNRLDIFQAMNRGSLILINTAKDLLKQDGCEILGRFFIALIAHATQERSAIPADKRRTTFVYIDEAQDYFDTGVEQLLNQARKYKVGLILAHQNLGQFEPRLQAAVMASTAIKIAGGVSAKDAGGVAREMGCAPEFLQSMRKRARHTEFACHIRSVTHRPVQLSVPFGQMEGKPRLSGGELAELLARNRARFSATGEDRLMPSSGAGSKQPKSGFALGKQEVL